MHCCWSWKHQVFYCPLAFLLSWHYSSEQCMPIAAYWGSKSLWILLFIGILHQCTVRQSGASVYCLLRVQEIKMLVSFMVILKLSAWKEKSNKVQKCQWTIWDARNSRTGKTYAYIFLQEDRLYIFFRFVPDIKYWYNLLQENTFSFLVFSHVHPSTSIKVPVLPG